MQENLQPLLSIEEAIAIDAQQPAAQAEPADAGDDASVGTTTISQGMTS